MASEVVKSGLLAKLANRGKEAFEKRKNDTLVYGNPTVPAGIEGGIAQLVDIKFGEYKEGDNKGKLFFMAVGIVKHPKEVDGVPVAGLRTQIGPEPICDTPNSNGKKKTLEDHLAWVLNQIRILGVEDLSKIKFEQLETVCSSLKKKKPFFRFRTWKGKKQDSGPYAGKEPMVQHEWNGRCEFTETIDPGDGVTEDSTSSSGAYPSSSSSSSSSSTNGVGQLEDRSSSSAEDTEGEEGYIGDEGSKEEEQGIDSETEEQVEQDFSEFSTEELVEQANDGNQGACKELEKQALKVGVSKEQVEDATDWAQVAQLTEKAKEKKASKGGSNKSGDKQVPKKAPTYTPAVGEPCKFHKKQGQKPLDCEIISVDEDSKKCNIRDLASQTNYKGVDWKFITEG